MTKPVTIPCHPCNGTGHRELPAEYVPTLNALTKLKSATCLRIRNALGADTSLYMVHKQVTRMESWGVVKKSKRTTPEDGDLRKAAWEFQVV